MNALSAVDLSHNDIARLNTLQAYAIQSTPPIFQQASLDFDSTRVLNPSPCPKSSGLPSNCAVLANLRRRITGLEGMPQKEYDSPQEV